MKSARRVIALLFLLLVTALTVYYYYPEQILPPNAKIDRLVVFKSKRQMLAYSKGHLLKTYTVSLGFMPIGAKQYEGDGKTPEGLYYINGRNPNSTCHKNLGISYPSAADVARCKKSGKPTGGDIKIHGITNGMGFIGKFHRWYDWTSGCIGVTDNEMDELYAAVITGSEIEINP